MLVQVTATDLGRLGLVAVTQLGDAWFLFGLLLVVHWYRPDWIPAGRRASATVIATALLAVASVVTAKAAIAAPRPPGATTTTVPSWLPSLLADAVREGATSDGFAFPSGHAVSATAVYGSLAVAADGVRGAPRRFRARDWLVAGTLVAAIAVSRVALGVHYPRDVVGGVALGGVVLAVGLAIDDPERTLALALVVALVGTAVAATGVGTAELPDAVGTVGGCVGGLLAWRWSSSAGARVPTGQIVVGGTLITAIWGVSVSVETLPVVAVGSAIAVGLGVAMPTLVERRSAGRR
jgi:membrane-associated phospholipid phosphatase